MLDLTGKVALITGCSSGIGEETARVFAKRGAKVVIVARRKEQLERLKEEIESNGGTAYVANGDVTAEGFAKEVCEKTVEVFGSLDILVNNAGISDFNAATSRTSDDLWNACININQTAVFTFCREALKIMEKNMSGSIVNVSSIGGVYSIAGAPYSSAKAAVIGLTKNIAIQYAGTGIRCNSVAPGPTETSMQGDDDRFDKEFQEVVGRREAFDAGMAQPVDIANSILFFASDESRYINGQTLVVDLGICL